MRFLKQLLICGLIVASTAILAQDQDSSRFDEELNERDFDALRDYLKQKRSVEIADNTLSNLTISGDVRTEYRHLNEACCGDSLRGSGRPFSQNDFDIEFNLRFDYICDRTWAVAHMRYDNSAGVDDNGHPCPKKNEDDEEAEDELAHCGGKCRQRAKCCDEDPEGFHGSGRCNDLCLKKAYFGYSFCKNATTRLDLELGRRGQLYNVFDSNIQFLSRLDGAFLKYQKTCESYGDFYIQGAAFVVDEKVNHFAWVTEVGVLNLADSNFDFKYSLIDWRKRGRNRCKVFDPIGFNFINSQWTVVYHVDSCYLKVPAKIYGAFLVNHAAKRLEVFRPCREGNGKFDRKMRENLGWYAGILVGKVVKEGDWAVEFQYQVVQAQAVPDDDCSGICRGNVLDESFTSCSQRGNTNFKGWKLEGLYAITDNLTLDTIVEESLAWDKRIGGSHHYSKFEMEAIYAF